MLKRILCAVLLVLCSCVYGMEPCSQKDKALRRLDGLPGQIYTYFTMPQGSFPSDIIIVYSDAGYPFYVPESYYTLQDTEDAYKAKGSDLSASTVLMTFSVPEVYTSWNVDALYAFFLLKKYAFTRKGFSSKMAFAQELEDHVLSVWFDRDALIDFIKIVFADQQNFLQHDDFSGEELLWCQVLRSKFILSPVLGVEHEKITKLGEQFSNGIIGTKQEVHDFCAFYQEKIKDFLIDACLLPWDLAKGVADHLVHG